MKVAVYAICLNEAAFIDRFMDAIGDGADVVVIADTGSTDGTIEAFHRRGVDPHAISIKPWRFDAARNAALALVPEDVDVCVSLDLDEVIMPGWRRVIERAWRAPINWLYYTHAWSQDVTGLWHQLLDNRIHARRGFAWRHACHETVMPEDEVVPHIGIVRHLRIEHHPDQAKDRGSYLPLLELAVKDEPESPRHAFYLGRELFTVGRPADALRELERCLALPTVGALGERCATLRTIARSHEALGDADAALAAWRRAADEAPGVRGPQLDLAWALYKRERWAECYDACLRAMAIPEEVAEYGCDSDFGVLAEDMAAICGWRLGHHHQALIYGRQALARAPSVERIRQNVARMEQALDAAPTR